MPGRELECHLDDSASIVLENGQAFNFTAPYLVPNTGNEGVDAMDVYVEDKNGKALVSARPHQFEGGPAEYEPIPGVVFVSPNNMPAGDTPELRVSIEAAGAGKLAVDAACVVG